MHKKMAVIQTILVLVGLLSMQIGTAGRVAAQDPQDAHATGQTSVYLPLVVGSAQAQDATVMAAGTAAQSIRQISNSGTSSPQTGGYTPSGEGDVTQAEFPGQEDEADGSPG